MDTAQQELVTQFNFRVTEVLKGAISVGDLVSVMTSGGTYVVMADGSHVPRQLVAVADFLTLGDTVFVASISNDGWNWTRGVESFVKTR